MFIKEVLSGFFDGDCSYGLSHPILCYPVLREFRVVYNYNTHNLQMFAPTPNRWRFNTDFFTISVSGE